MFIVHVNIGVKPEYITKFKEATLKNAQASLKESGITRFDVLQETDHPNHFVLVEVYRTQEDTLRHKETDHYQRWKDAVEDMLPGPRTKNIYINIFPDDLGWE